MRILRKGSGHGRKFRNCKRKNVGVIFLLSITHAATDLLKLPSSAWVYLGLLAHGPSLAGLYKAPGCHCG